MRSLDEMLKVIFEQGSEALTKEEYEFAVSLLSPEDRKEFERLKEEENGKSSR